MDEHKFTYQYNVHVTSARTNNSNTLEYVEITMADCSDPPSGISSIISMSLIGITHHKTPDSCKLKEKTREGTYMYM